ncbi:MAG: hypothetical protein IPG93_19195 [Burkholderiales bacterium]|nr:hypothetical protein [Burkholderiales bacterium]
MKNERPADDADAIATEAWFDGLAGRRGHGADHSEGARIRDALDSNSKDEVVASWRNVEARSLAQSASEKWGASNGTERTGSARAEDSANGPWLSRWWGWAAAILLGVGLVTVMQTVDRSPEATVRGITGQPSSGPRWLVERPTESAQALAAELRSLQAEVTIAREGDGVVLRIRVPAGAVNAVNARLVPLETGLDGDGTLELAVVPVQ